MSEERKEWGEQESTINFIELTEHILDSYLNASTEETMDILDLLDESMSVIGTGKHEFYRNLEEFYQSFQFEVKQREQVHFEWENFQAEESAIDETTHMVYGSVFIRGMFENGYAIMNMDTRFTMLYGLRDGKWRVLHIHHSIPDKEQKANEEFPRTLGMQVEESRHLIMGLAADYIAVYTIDLEQDIGNIVKLDEEILRKAGALPENFCYSENFCRYTEERIYSEDRESFLKLVLPEGLKEQFADGREKLEINFRVAAGGKITHYSGLFIRTSKPGEPIKLVVGFRNTEDIISTQRDYQRKLIAAKEEADRANAAKTDFLLRMSHDIRTPINGIMGMLDIGEKYKDDLDKQGECREKIRGASKILLELINEVLDMNKLESGEIVLEHEAFSLQEVVSEVFQTVTRQAEEKRVEILEEEIDVPHSRLLGSAIYLKRLMINIIGNAVKYNKENGKVFLSCRELGFDGKTAKLEFRCRDTGIGMSPEFVQRIFEPFTQENISARSKYEGTGLGMSIAKSIVDKMEGTISVTSEKGKGSIFTAVLPFDVDTSENNKPEIEETEESDSLMGMKFLVAEDNELNMEIVKFQLEKEGIDVIEAWNGLEAVELFRESKVGEIQAILMDIMMPEMDGYEATRRIRSMEREDAGEIPIIAMTANAFAEDKVKAREAGMNEHIAKPIDTKRMARMIRRFVSGKKIRGEE